MALTHSQGGLSPRGRGNHFIDSTATSYPRSIPAWAGKPILIWYLPAVCRVYPRVGGETWPAQRSRPSAWGLSPRGRGNHPGRLDSPTARGSIPAWAGKPAWPAAPGPAGRVYPRVGGETALSPAGSSSGAGLSPRGRGNHNRKANDDRGGGSIPAWAGKPWPAPSPAAPTPVYPRVGGETLITGRGEEVNLGLSPRGRGNPTPPRPAGKPTRSIPAWAGKPRHYPAPNHVAAVYPRVGGETVSGRSSIFSQTGLSPRGRGNRLPVHPFPNVGGSIPAWAGKPPHGACWRTCPTVYPRVGGETASLAYLRRLSRGLSPRGRGNRYAKSMDTMNKWSIPAWAGKPWPELRIPTSSRVYPRVGGETPRRHPFEQIDRGLSPRGRGNLRPRPAGDSGAGSIPAWAGKP